ncbi:hypothetical protein HK097_004989, partial [Rhizophlyctis rosea]
MEPLFTFAQFNVTTKTKTRNTHMAECLLEACLVSPNPFWTSTLITAYRNHLGHHPQSRLAKQLTYLIHPLNLYTTAGVKQLVRFFMSPQTTKNLDTPLKVDRLALTIRILEFCMTKEEEKFVLAASVESDEWVSEKGALAEVNVAQVLESVLCFGREALEVERKDGGKVRDATLRLLRFAVGFCKNVVEGFWEGVERRVVGTFGGVDETGTVLFVTPGEVEKGKKKRMAGPGEGVLKGLVGILLFCGRKEVDVSPDVEMLRKRCFEAFKLFLEGVVMGEAHVKPRYGVRLRTVVGEVLERGLKEDLRDFVPGLELLNRILPPPLPVLIKGGERCGGGPQDVDAIDVAAFAQDAVSLRGYWRREVEGLRADLVLLIEAAGASLDKGVSEDLRGVVKGLCGLGGDVAKWVVDKVFGSVWEAFERLKGDRDGGMRRLGRWMRFLGAVVGTGPGRIALLNVPGVLEKLIDLLESVGGETVGTRCFDVILKIVEGLGDLWIIVDDAETRMTRVEAYGDEQFTNGSDQLLDGDVVRFGERVLGLMSRFCKTRSEEQVLRVCANIVALPVFKKVVARKANISEPMLAVCRRAVEVIKEGKKEDEGILYHSLEVVRMILECDSSAGNIGADAGNLHDLKSALEAFIDRKGAFVKEDGGQWTGTKENVPRLVRECLDLLVEHVNHGSKRNDLNDGMSDKLTQPVIIGRKRTFEEMVSDLPVFEVADVAKAAEIVDLSGGEDDLFESSEEAEKSFLEFENDVLPEFDFAKRMKLDGLKGVGDLCLLHSQQQQQQMQMQMQGGRMQQQEQQPPQQTQYYRQYARNEFRTTHVNRKANTSRPPSVHVDQYEGGKGAANEDVSPAPVGPVPQQHQGLMQFPAVTRMPGFTMGYPYGIPTTTAAAAATADE